MSIATAFASVLMAVSQPSAATCTSIPGWESATSNQRIRWIVIGEIHGNNESPAIFADAVCLTARSRRVVVALEQGADNQEAIDALSHLMEARLRGEPCLAPLRGTQT